MVSAVLPQNLVFGADVLVVSHHGGYLVLLVIAGALQDSHFPHHFLNMGAGLMDLESKAVALLPQL